MDIEDLPQMTQLHRKKTRLNRIELAKLAGVNKKVIFDIEHGKKSIQLDTLLKVLTVLNIHIQLVSPLLKNEEHPH